MIRPACAADRATLIAMGERFIRGVYQDVLRAHPESLGALCDGLLALPDEGKCFLVDERDGAAQGMIAVVLMTHPMSGELAATELFWWVDPAIRGSGLRLLKAAETWAKDRGALKLFLVAPNEEVEALYERLHYTQVETSFQKAL